MTIAVTYVCMAIAFMRRQMLTTRELWLLLRAMWCTVALCWINTTLQTALACGAVLVASFLVSRRVGWIVFPAAWLLSPIAPIAFALGWICAWSAIDRRAPMVKLLAFWSSFILTFAVLLPREIAVFGGTPSTARTIGCVALVCFGASFAFAGSRAFALAGGTPEPLDPPPRLCTGGIYAHLRHPLQLAEIAFVAAGVLYYAHPAHLTYLIAFTVALVGPLRIIEERHLRERFDAASYIARTPAYFPRLRSAQRHVDEVA